MATTIRIEGLEALERKLGKAVADSTLRAALEGAAKHVKGTIDVYPRLTDANREPASHGWWYERGQGGFYKRKDGTRRKTSASETLGRKWTIKVNARSAVVGNNVSYGPYVHDPERQSAAMKRIGWKTTEDVANEEADAILRNFVKVIDRALR